MRVTQLSLSDFRSYRDLDLALQPGVTTLVGRNGEGKTNVVEALRYLSTLTSHRVATDAPLVRRGAERATIRANVEKAGRSLTLDVSIVAGGANSARLNRNPVKPRDIAGILRTVVFSPEDLELVRGEPASRRRFMDELCVALAPMIAGDLADYERVARQKAALLKTSRGKSVDLHLLDVWDEKLADLGARIMRARLAAIHQLAPYVEAAYAAVSADGACRIEYATALNLDGAAAVEVDSTDALAARLLEAIALARPRERERGVCLVGPHRDDLDLVIDELPARGYASHGESWSCALALRLATYDLLAAEAAPGETDGEPVLILDDVFAELDGTRRSALAGRVAGARQVIVTAAVPEDVPPVLGGELFLVNAGEVTRVEGSSGTRT